MSAYEEQLKQYSSSSIHSLTFVIGDKGLGKSYFIHDYYKKKKNILYIKEQSFKSHFLEPIICALEDFENSMDMVFDNLNVVDIVRKKMLDLCKIDDIVFCFESFNSYQDDMAEFCIGFLQAYLDNASKYNAFILIELDSDVYALNNSLIKRLYSLTVNTNFIKFKKRTEQELIEIIYNSFNYKINITEKEQNYIIQSCFGNVSYLFIIINFLKQEGYVFFDGSKWVCKSLPSGILNYSVEEYIKQRYNRLDDELKRILQKSSLLGMEFSSIQLQKTFNLLKVEEELSKIEKISALIRKNDIYDNDKYLFETEDVCNNIQNLIPNNEKKNWNKMLADYYEIQYNKQNQSLIKRLENCCRLAIYCRNCGNIEKAIIFKFRAIRYCIYLLDYKHALELISKFKENFQYSLKNKQLYSEILKLEAYCYYRLGKYEMASGLYAELLTAPLYSVLEKMEIRYLYADALYFVGKVSETLEILLELKNQLQIKHNDKLLFKVLSELATVYGFFREYGPAREYFSYSVNQCHDANLKLDYYIQLRKSSMFWDLNLTTSLMQHAVEYFETSNNIQELARTYHNIGTDLLYLGKSEQAINYLNQAVEEFQKYGSDEIHYTYNCIGVYYAAYEQNFEKAIEYFEKAISFNPVLFSTMVLNINMASCSKKLHNDEAVGRYLNEAMKLQKLLGDEIPSYSLYLLINQGLYAKLDGRLEESKSYLKKSLKYKLNTNQLYLVGKNLTDISENVDNTILKYTSLEVEPLYKNFYINDICLSTLRFWE